jgi:type IV pilus assembly protein PilW
MKPTIPHTHSRQTGFGLAEILVGLVIGLLATLVILQVFSVFEGQKRTTEGNTDAQTSGNVALYSIKRDLEMAGYGLLPIGVAGVVDSPLECSPPNLNFNDSGVTSLAPVTITDGGTLAGASDIITIRYSTSQSGGSYSTIKAVGVADNINNAKTFTIGENMGCNVGDVAIAISGTGLCNLTAISGVSVVSASGVPDTSGISLATDISVVGAGGTGVLSNLACLGKWKEVEYRINPNYNPLDPNNSQAYLQRNDTPSDPTKAVPSVVDIVNIQAQYGISASPDSNQIILWTNATGSWAANAITVANRNRIKAVRIAVVARNGLLEKTNVSESYNGKACSSLSSDAPNGVCAWSGTSAATNPPSDAPEIDLSNDPNWQRYRYRVYETIIPLRNVIWSRKTL